MTIWDVLLLLVDQVKSEQDAPDIFLLSRPTGRVSYGENERNLQTRASSRTDFKRDMFMTGTIDEMISNKSSAKIVIENKIFQYLDRDNPELPFQEGVYVWRDEIQSWNVLVQIH